jgi:DNA ligase-1
MKFSVISQYLEKLNETASRIEITKILSELFTKTDDDVADSVAYIITGSIAPSYSGSVFNIAEKNVIQILAQYGEKTPEEIEKLYKEKGDLGDVAEILAKKTNEKSDQEVSVVMESLKDIAKITGEGSVNERNEKVVKLLEKNNPTSVKFLVRMLLGNMRLGFSDKTVIDALSWMLVGDKSLKGKIQKHFEVVPDIGLIAKKIKTENEKFLSQTPKPVIGIPVAPMLAQRVKSAKVMIEKMGEVAVEPKFDGVRMLIHIKKGKLLKAFTRNLKDISQMFPELEMAQDDIMGNEVILDAEGVGVDEERKALADFQTTMQRRRKHDIEEIAKKIPVTFQAFDILFVDGESVMNMPYEKRREILAKTIKKDGKIIKVDEFVRTTDPKVIEDEYVRRRKEGLEGILVKKIDATYVPGRTGYRWVKMKEKESASSKLADTIDGVIMGFTVGKGKRVDFGLGQFLVGIKDGEEIKTVTKVGTGLSDELLRSLAQRLEKIKMAQMPREYKVHKDLEPDVWVKPEVVVEIAGDDLTVSPKHTAGYAIRFPRLIRIRDDKSVKETTTIKELKTLAKLKYK